MATRNARFHQYKIEICVGEQKLVAFVQTLARRLGIGNQESDQSVLPSMSSFKTIGIPNISHPFALDLPFFLLISFTKTKKRNEKKFG